MKKIFLYAVLCPFLFSGCVKDNEDNGRAEYVSIGDVLPAFSVELSDGSTMTTESLSGKVSLIMFFSTTCPDCQAQFPAVEQIYNDFKDNDQVVVVAISRAEGSSAVSAFWRENSLTMPYSAQTDRTVYNLFAESVVPRIYISDKNRVVRAAFTDNPIAGYAELSSVITGLIN